MLPERKNELAAKERQLCLTKAMTVQLSTGEKNSQIIQFINKKK